MAPAAKTDKLQTGIRRASGDAGWYWKSEIALPIAGAWLEIGNLQWPRRIQTLNPDHHEIIHSLTPRPRDSQVCYESVGSGSQFAAIGNTAFFPADLPFVGRSIGGPQKLLHCRIPRTYFEDLAMRGEEWSARKLLAAADISAHTIQVLLRRLADEMISPGLASELFVESLLNMLMIEIARHLDDRTATKEQRSKLSAWQLRRIDERLGDSVNGAPCLEELAVMCGIGQRHLMRAFKATTGVTVHAYVSAALIRRARVLLTESDLPLKQIALRLGYRHAASFTVAFHRACGETPRNFRDRRRGS